MSVQQRNFHKILTKSGFDGGAFGKVLEYATASKSVRLNIIREKKDDAETCAAIEIQRIFRGYISRCDIQNYIAPAVSQLVMYQHSQTEVDRLKDVATPEAYRKLESPRDRRDHNDEYQSQKDTASFEKHVASSKKDIIPKAQSNIVKPRAVIEKKPRFTKDNLSHGKAASIIQRAWRRHIDIQVYRYYRDLINFKNRGQPSMMLRCINPAEAKLLEPAAGVHIKFRLGGTKFPPNIYYKIFTHRPIQDMCANSPKDYTQADSKRCLPRDIHNKGDRIPASVDTHNWYQRIENNGWRLVSDRLLRHPMNDAITWETTNKKQIFSHNKLLRKTDVEKKKRQKKIEWMKKMYKEGMMKAKVDDAETVKLIEGAAAGMMATLERHGDQVVQDWEVDELLDWTTGLNFDDYVLGWKEIATSATSDKSVGDRFNIKTSKYDPYELEIGNIRGGSTRQSHNTPASSATSLV